MRPRTYFGLVFRSRYTCTSISEYIAFPFLLFPNANEMIYFLALLCNCFQIVSNHQYQWKAPAEHDNSCYANSSESCPLFSGAVICDDGSFKLQTHTRSCVTSDNGTNAVVAGSCFQAYTNVAGLLTLYGEIPISDTAELDRWMCGHSNREGTLCGKCNDQSRINLNSLLYDCIPSDHCHKFPWMQHVLFQYVPLTAIFILFMLLRPRLLSPSMSSYIHLSQILSLPIIVYNIRYCLAMSTNYRSNLTNGLTSVIELLYGVWNLSLPDFMQFSSCLPLSASILDALALQYVVALYCLLLVALFYASIELHAHNFRPFVLAWTPFKNCFARYLHSLNPRASFIDVFGMFFLLSYTKIVSTSVYLLLPIPLFNCSGGINRYVLFFDGAINYTSWTHLPYMFLAIFMLLNFGILPVVLLICFQFKPFQYCLRVLKMRRPGLIAFVEIFHGHYKDGTNGDSDYRFFAGIRFITWLVAVCLANLSAPYKSCEVLALLWILGIMVFTLVFCPYKKKAHNFTESLVLLYLVILLQLNLLLDASHFITHIRVTVFLSYCLFLLPPLCIVTFCLFSKHQILECRCGRWCLQKQDEYGPINECEPLINSV